MFNCWAILVRSRDIAPGELQELINFQTEQIITAFFKSVLYPPYGSREITSEAEVNEDEEEDESDRKAFSDILNPFGFFGQNAFIPYTSNVIKIFNDNLQQFLNFSRSCTEAELRIWQENFHWTLLLTS